MRRRMRPLESYSPFNSAIGVRIIQRRPGEDGIPKQRRAAFGRTETRKDRFRGNLAVGGAERDRTADLLIANEAFSQTVALLPQRRSFNPNCLRSLRSSSELRQIKFFRAFSVAAVAIVWMPL